VCVSALLVLLAGCEPTSRDEVGGAASPSKITEQQRELLQRLDDFEKKTGMALDSLMSEAERRQATAEAQGGLGLFKDVQAAQAVLRDAAEAAQQKKAERTAAALDRLSRLVLCMRAELPAAVISQNVERAIAAVKLGSHLPDASAALLVAYDEGVRGNAATGTAHLVPKVLEDIDRAKGHVDNGREQEAISVLEVVLDKSAQEPVSRLLAGVNSGLLGAQDALERQAWPVVQAELLEVDRMLAEVSSRVAPETPAPPTTEGSEEAGAPSEGEAGGAEATAETGAEEAAPTQESAGGESPAPEEAPQG